jgi:hypothetical protein
MLYSYFIKQGEKLQYGQGYLVVYFFHEKMYRGQQVVSLFSFVETPLKYHQECLENDRKHSIDTNIQRIHIGDSTVLETISYMPFQSVMTQRQDIFYTGCRLKIF